MEIYLYGGVLVIYMFLGFVSRNNREENKRWMYPPARWVYEKICSPGRRSFAEHSQVRRDLSVFSPAGKLQEQEQQFYIQRIRTVLCVIFAGNLLAIASFVARGSETILVDGGRLMREPIGGEDRTISLSVSEGVTGDSKSDGEDVNLDQRMEITVHARRYSNREVSKLADQAAKELGSVVLGANKDAQHVNNSLNAVIQMDGYPFEISWTSSEYALLDSDGTVHTDALGEDSSRSVTLTAKFYYDNGTEDPFVVQKEYEFVIVHSVQSEAEKNQEALLKELKDSDEESADRTEWVLPEKVRGIPLLWKEETSTQSAGIFAFSFLVAVVLYVLYAARLREQVKTRNVNLRLEYPALISKMVLYLGAGMSVRSTFMKLGEEYREKVDSGGAKKYAYEEILLMCRALQGGMSEADAYAMLGTRCHVKQYMRLSTLLVQHLRKGNGELLSALLQEAKTSYEERGNIARELGEEAETKLLFPMMLMLAVTMVMIIVPAYYGFTG